MTMLENLLVYYIYNVWHENIVKLVSKIWEGLFSVYRATAFMYDFHARGPRHDSLMLNLIIIPFFNILISKQ